jgi:hypothetical protein
MTMRLSCLIAALTLFSILLGCGGGGSATVGGGVITDEQRMAVLDLIGQKVNSLPNVDPDADSQEVLAFIQGRPEFKRAGLTGGGDVWGEFTDVRIHLVINNRTPDTSRSSRASPTRATPVELPSTVNALLLYAFGQDLTPPIDDIGAWLTSGNYSVVLNHSVGVDDLKGINGTHGVFYIDAHGAVFPVPVGTGSVDSFGLSTSTIVTKQNLSTYRADHEDLSMVTGTVRNLAAGRSVTVNQLIWLITDKFVEKYHWKFAKNSFVFINACESENAPFRQACFKAGASVYAGWTNPVYDAHAYPTAKFLFDQLLGANNFIVYNPKQRPFEWPALFAMMKSQGLDEFPSRKGQTKFVLTQNPNDAAGTFALLSPTISSLNMAGQNTLNIDGLFGTNEKGDGSVTIGGTPVTAFGWSGTRIVCDLSTLPPDLHGDVVVTVAGHNSNVVQLTMWEGELHLKETGQGSLETHADIKFRVRGDVHLARLAPDTEPSKQSTQFFKEALDSVCTVGASGSHDDPEMTYHLNGSPNLPIEVGNQPNVANFKYSGSIDPSANVIHFFFSVRGVDKGRIVAPDLDDVIFPIFFLHSSFRSALDNTGAIAMRLNGDFSLQSGSFTEADGEITTTLNWSTIPASSPPKADAARSVGRRSR